MPYPVISKFTARQCEFRVTSFRLIGFFAKTSRIKVTIFTWRNTCDKEMAKFWAAFFSSKCICLKDQHVQIWLLIWSSLNKGDKMYLHRETCHPYLEHAHLYERRKCHEHLQEVFTSLPKLEVELGSLAQKWASGLQSYTMFSTSAESLE